MNPSHKERLLFITTVHYLGDSNILPEAAELLFELGSEDRLRILSELLKEPLKLSRIAKSLASTIQETSRQCQRLEEAGLIEKHSDGRFGLTPVGRISESLLPAFALLESERGYFTSHDASTLPATFVERLGELSDYKRLDHVDESLRFQQRVVKESESFVWFMSDQPIGHSLHADHSHFSKNTTLRMILPKSVDTEIFRAAKSQMGPRFEIGLVDDVRIALAMNERIAAIVLPTLDGRIDYGQGFCGDSQNFHQWCSDLFRYYWEKSVKKYPEKANSE